MPSNFDFNGFDATHDLLLGVRGDGAEASTWARLRLESNLKIGQFSFSEQDLSLPVNGIPLTVTRTYNSLNPLSGDFGYSWSMALNSMDIELDDERANIPVSAGLGAFFDFGDDDAPSDPLQTTSIRIGGGWDVTLTLPDGRRTTFTFGTSGQWPNLRAVWNAPSDVNATLKMTGNNEIVFGLAGWNVPSWPDSDFVTGLAPFENHDIPVENLYAPTNARCVP